MSDRFFMVKKSVVIIWVTESEKIMLRILPEDGGIFYTPQCKIGFPRYIPRFVTKFEIRERFLSGINSSVQGRAPPTAGVWF